MKIRIKGNSIRYRLSTSDLADLLAYSLLSEETDFVGTKLIYSVQLTADEKISTDFKDHVITLHIPSSKVVRLSTADEIGFSDQSGPVHIMVERDLTCADNMMKTY